MEENMDKLTKYLVIAVIIYLAFCYLEIRFTDLKLRIIQAEKDNERLSEQIEKLEEKLDTKSNRLLEQDLHYENMPHFEFRWNPSTGRFRRVGD